MTNNIVNNKTILEIEMVEGLFSNIIGRSLMDIS